MTDTKPQVTPRRIVSVLLRGWWILVIAGLLGGMLAFAFASAQTPKYLSTASNYFSLRSATSGADINQGSAYTQNQMLSFAQLAMSAIVLDSVRVDLDLDVTNAEIRTMTSVSIPQNTVILDITASSADSEFAADLANAIARELAGIVSDISPRDDAGEATVAARVIDPAIPALYQTSPNKQRDALLGALLGVVVAALAIALWTLFDTRVRSEHVLRRITSLPLLGEIPLRKDRSREAVVVARPNSTGAEAYRTLRSSLRFAAVEHEISTIAVTSSIPAEGKTSTAVNLALAYVEAGYSVLLVDADLRRPMVAEILGLENAVGLTTMLVGLIDFDDAKLSWGSTRLCVLPAGEVPPNPAELLASVRMSEILEELRPMFDIMIVDTAPLLSVADATIIAPLMDTTIVVADSTRVHAAQLERALSSLSAVRAFVAGVLLNRVKRPQRDAYQYYQADQTPPRWWLPSWLDHRRARYGSEIVADVDGDEFESEIVADVDGDEFESEIVADVDGDEFESEIVADVDGDEFESEIVADVDGDDPESVDAADTDSETASGEIADPDRKHLK